MQLVGMVKVGARSCITAMKGPTRIYVQGRVRVTPENLKESCSINPVAEEWQQAVITIFIMLILMEI